LPEVIREKLLEYFDAFADKSDDEKRLNYVQLLMHFAGEVALTESILSSRWEMIWEMLGSKWEPIDSRNLIATIQDPKVFSLILISSVATVRIIRKSKLFLLTGWLNCCNA
jgi:hypothetical protein